MEYLKDYDFELFYYSCKANIVEDAWVGNGCTCHRWWWKS